MKFGCLLGAGSKDDEMRVVGQFSFNFETRAVCVCVCVRVCVFGEKNLAR